MGSNEAGEPRAGREGALPRYPTPPGLIWIDLPVRSRRQTHAGTNTQIRARTTIFLGLQVGAVRIRECVQWVADEGEPVER